MQDLLFASPWWLLLLLIGGGGFVWYTGNTRSEKNLQIAGIVIALLGVTLAVTSWLIQTDKEFVEQHSRQIVDAVNRRDWAAAEKLLDPQTSLEGIYKNRQQLIDGAKKTVDAIGLTNASVISLGLKQTDTLITVDLSIMSTQEISYSRPTITSWRFDWEDTGKGWKLRRIEPQENDQFSKEDVVRHLQRP